MDRKSTSVSAPAEHIHFENLSRLTWISGARVIDVGCGTGALVRRLRQEGAYPTGIECAPAQIEAARGSDPAHRETYIEGVAEALPLQDTSFDLATFWYSLHHVPVDRMAKALEEAHRVLNPGGVLYVLEPVAEGPCYELDRIIDDERVVRAEAQAALDAINGFRNAASTSYETAYTYGSLDVYVEEMVRIDPARQELVDGNRGRLQDAYRQFGTPGPEGRSFTQPNVVRMFEKT